MPGEHTAPFTDDPVGNRLSMTVDGRTTSYSYNALDQMLTSGTATFSYDGRGNLTRVVDGAGTTTYTFDPADRLVGATLPDGTSVGYGYDADGRRVESTVGGQVTRYLWDEASAYGDVALETDGNGAPLASYVLGGPEMLSHTRGGVTSYYLHDGQGSVRGLADAAGALTDTYSYTVFGEPFAQTGSTVNSYLYTGQQFDALTGFYSLRARYFDPALGRFLSQDTAPNPADMPLDLNRYGYVANNPIGHTDPSGHTFLDYITAVEAEKVLGGTALGWLSDCIGGSIFYCMAAAGLCGPGAQQWAGQTDLRTAASQGAAIGAAAAALYFAFPSFAFGLSALGMGVAAIGFGANPTLCSGLALMLTVAGGSGSANRDCGVWKRVVGDRSVCASRSGARSWRREFGG